MFSKSQLTYRGSRSLKYASLLAVIIFIISACDDGVLDSNYNSPYSIANIESMADTSEIYSTEISQSECINPDDPEFNEKTVSKIVEWGNPRNPFIKTVDIIYFNTLDQFVLKVKSSHNIVDVLVDDESIKNFNGRVSPNTWQEFTFELEQDWEAGDTWAFEVEVTGSGPPVYFDVDYTLISECLPDCGTVNFLYDGIVVTYGTVIGANNRCWLDRNLGASRVAQSSSDSEAYGDLFQWGRLVDGHEKRNSPTTTTLSSTDTPGHGDFIIVTPAPNSPLDWRSPQNNNLWQGVNGINNPCPSGYRLPTQAEWEAELQSWSSDDSAGAFASPLRLPAAGIRGDLDGSINAVGTNGAYWSSTASDESTLFMGFDPSNTFMFMYRRANGYSVRCIMD